VTIGLCLSGYVSILKIQIQTATDCVSISSSSQTCSNAHSSLQRIVHTAQLFPSQAPIETDIHILHLGTAAESARRLGAGGSAAARLL
jgi:hypothetical protein